MPRNVFLSQNSQPGAGLSSTTATPPQPIPAIRFISATPSVQDLSVPQIETNMDEYPLPTDPVAPFTSTPLAPRADAPRKRLVPKKSKLSLLAASTKALGKDKAKSKGKADDFSDVVRRVGAPSSGGNGGFEIYVDHSIEEENSLIVVKKKKSRAALDNVGWGSGVLGERTNTSNAGTSAPGKENKGSIRMLKIPSKADENQNSKWWNVSIGRGRRDSKGKEKVLIRSKSKYLHVRCRHHTHVPYILLAPEPFVQADADHEPRARFNSLDSSRLLSVPGYTVSSSCLRLRPFMLTVILADDFR